MPEYTKLSHSKRDLQLAVPVNGSAKKLELYQLTERRTPEEQLRLLDSLLNTQLQFFRKAFDQLKGKDDKDMFLDCLKNLNSSLKIDPIFVTYLVGMPLSEFLYESNQEELTSFLRDLLKQIDLYKIELNSGQVRSIDEYMTGLHSIITDYTGKTFLDLKEKKYIPLPPDEWTF